jgi:hypothetical protein
MRARSTVTQVEKCPLRARPFDQFVDGYFCEACGYAFVADEASEK